ncbi:hypothetical protein [Rhodocaloribacter sp.]
MSLDPGPQADAVVLRAMVLLASFSTAAEVWKTVAERRAGRDPSAQEAEAVVRPYLWEARRALDEGLMRLQGNLAYLHTGEEERVPGLVRRFENLMTLGRVARRLHVVHQRLLSLYPGVSDALVEAARRLRSEAAALLEVEEELFPGAVGPFLERALGFTAWMERELAAGG